MHDETSSYNVCCSMPLVMQVGDNVSKYSPLMFLLHRPTLMMNNEPLDNQLALSFTTADMFSIRETIHRQNFSLISLLHCQKSLPPAPGHILFVPLFRATDTQAKASRISSKLGLSKTA